MTQLAWHYTVGVRAQSIFNDGVIKPATAGVPPGETPVVWFSGRGHWEPTANKMLQAPDGSLVRLTFEETIKWGKGGWRFGLPRDRLVPWRKLIGVANIGPATAKALAKSATRQGADAAMWYGTPDSVAVADTVIEVLNEGEWVRYTEPR